MKLNLLKNIKFHSIIKNGLQQLPVEKIYESESDGDAMW